MLFAPLNHWLDDHPDPVEYLSNIVLKFGWSIKPRAFSPNELILWSASNSLIASRRSLSASESIPSTRSSRDIPDLGPPPVPGPKSVGGSLGALLPSGGGAGGSFVGSGALGGAAGALPAGGALGGAAGALGGATGGALGACVLGALGVLIFSPVLVKAPPALLSAFPVPPIALPTAPPIAWPALAIALPIALNGLRIADDLPLEQCVDILW